MYKKYAGMFFIILFVFLAIHKFVAANEQLANKDTVKIINTTARPKTFELINGRKISVSIGQELQIPRSQLVCVDPRTPSADFNATGKTCCYCNTICDIGSGCVD